MLTTDVYPDVFLLSGIFPFGVKLSLLGRLLSDDEAEMKRMKTYLLRGHNGRRVPEEEIFHGLIDTVLDPSRDGRVDDEQHRWSKDGWYCLRCIKDLYRQRFMAWWRQTKEIGTLPAFVSAYSASVLTVGIQLSCRGFSSVHFRSYQVLVAYLCPSGR